MRFQALAVAAILALGALATACVGSGDNADNAGDPAASPATLLEDTKLAPRNTPAPVPAPTSTNTAVVDPVGCGKMKSACAKEQQVKGLL